MKLEINSQSPEALRLAYRFWIELDRPARFHNRKTLEAWSMQMDGLYRESGLDFEGFKWFVIWALRPDDPDGARLGNEFTAKNLRMARDPMGSLVKQFNVAFTIFEEKSEKIVPLLKAKREQEAGTVLCEICSSPALSGKSLCKSCFDEMGAPSETEQQDPKLRPGESVDEWIERHFAPIRNDLRCPHCGYSDPFTDDERTAWCSDCWEERQMYIEDDLELLLEVPSVSCLTVEWESCDSETRDELLRTAGRMYNEWLAAPVDGSRISEADLQWAVEEDLAAIIWLAELNRDGKAREYLSFTPSPAPRFTRFAEYRTIVHGRVVEQHQQWV